MTLLPAWLPSAVLVSLAAVCVAGRLAKFITHTLED